MRRVNMHMRRVNMRMRQVNMRMHRVNMRMRRVNMRMRQVNMRMRQVNMHMRRVNMPMRRVNMHMRRVNMRMRQVNMRMRRVNMRMRRVNMRMRRVNMRMRQVNMRMRRVNMCMQFNRPSPCALPHAQGCEQLHPPGPAVEERWRRQRRASEWCSLMRRAAPPALPPAVAPCNRAVIGGEWFGGREGGGRGGWMGVAGPQSPPTELSPTAEPKNGVARVSVRAWVRGEMCLRIQLALVGTSHTLPLPLIASPSHCLSLSLPLPLIASPSHCLSLSLPLPLIASPSHCLSLSLPLPLIASSLIASSLIASPSHCLSLALPLPRIASLTHHSPIPLPLPFIPSHCHSVPLYLEKKTRFVDRVWIDMFSNCDLPAAAPTGSEGAVQAGCSKTRGSNSSAADSNAPDISDADSTPLAAGLLPGEKPVRGAYGGESIGIVAACVAAVEGTRMAGEGTSLHSLVHAIQAMLCAPSPASAHSSPPAPLLTPPAAALSQALSPTQAAHKIKGA
ncbi:unnamed protein product [Closterium sp. NIES-65]|nr:unnamed protein product [Closterium sp. NIES-65]